MIELRIEKRYKNMIRSDSSASLVAEGLLGSQYVDIQRSFNGTPLGDGKEIATIPSTKVTPQEFWSSLAKVADCVKETKQSVSSAAPTAAANPLKRTP